MDILETLKSSSLGNAAYTSYRIYQALLRSFGYTAKNIRYALTSKEHHTYTYSLTRENRLYLAMAVSKITDQDLATIEGYFEEIENDQFLGDYIRNSIKDSPKYRNKKDSRYDLASRTAFYAIIRAKKCKTVVENGTDIGYCSILLCSALLKNRQEGYEGVFYGLDIDPKAGLFVQQEPYKSCTRLIIGDAIESFSKIEEPIDFYFSDGFRTADYEDKEFAALQKHLSPNAVVISNKINFSSALAHMAVNSRKDFFYFQEQPRDHWYAGSGLGIMY